MLKEQEKGKLTGGTKLRVNTFLLLSHAQLLCLQGALCWFMFLSIFFCFRLCVCMFACVCKRTCMCTCMNACWGLRLTWGAFLDQSTPYKVSQLKLEVIRTTSLSSQFVPEISVSAFWALRLEVDYYTAQHLCEFCCSEFQSSHLSSECFSSWAKPRAFFLVLSFIISF